MAALFEPKLSTFNLAYLRDDTVSGGKRDWVEARAIVESLKQAKSRNPKLGELHRVSDLGVEEELRELVAAGLVRKRSLFGLSPTRYKLSPNFTRLQKLVGFGLDGILTAQAHTIAVSPVFGTASRVPLDVFLVMPFETGVSTAYEPIKQACASLGLRAARGDDLFTANHVMADIWSSLWCAKLVVADCTSRNPNVFYELGIAHTVGKPIILLTKDAGDVPFDLRHMRYIVYSDNSEGEADLVRGLRRSICETLGLQISEPTLAAGR